MAAERLFLDSSFIVARFNRRDQYHTAATTLTTRLDRGQEPWSLVDCASFVLMEDRQITAALTSDHHFVQAGFRALLLEELGL